MADPIRECRKMLEKWDDGEIVWTIEMGGLGPGYEQCIQITMFEMLRFIIERPLNYRYFETEKDRPWDERYYWNAYKRSRDLVVFAEGSLCEGLGLTGAQAGAAFNLATVFLKHGHQAGLDQVKKERQTMVRKGFPGTEARAAQ